MNQKLTRKEAVEEARLVLEERYPTDDGLIASGAHCARIGVEPGSIIADAIGLELVRRGLAQQ